MSSWTFSAIYANLSSAWERNFNFYQNVETVEASDMLREIDEILRKTDTVRENHQTCLPPSQYENFKAQHSTLHWVLTDAERQYGELKDPKLQRHRTPAQLLAEQEACEDHIANLLENVKTYRSTLLEASRHARLETSPAFPGIEPTQTELQSVAQAQPEAPSATQAVPPALTVPTLPQVTSFTSRPPSPPRAPSISILPTNVGLMGKLKTQLVSSFQNRAQPAGQTLLEASGFAVILAHIPVDPANNVYRRQISVKLDDQQVELCDPQLHVLEAGKVDVDDKTLAAVFMLVAQRMLEPETFQKTIEELRGEID